MTQPITLQDPRATFDYMPPLMLIYGRNGIGKSYLAAHFKKPIFLDLDRNIYELPVISNRSLGTDLTRFSEVIAFLDRLIEEEHPCKTVVVDSLSSLERMIESHILQGKRATSLADFQYGQGYQMMMPLWEQVLSKLTQLRIGRRLNVVMLGHYKEKRDPNLTGESYQHYQIDLYEKAAKLLVNSCSAVLFADYKVHVVHEKEKFGQDVAKVRSSERRLYTNEGVKFLAKNTYGMPDDIPMTYEAIAEYVKAHFTHLENLLNPKESQPEDSLTTPEGE